MLERPDELFRGMLLELFELRYGGSVDRPVHAAQKEGLTPEARRRARGRDYGPHRPQRRLARDGRHERAAGDGGKGAVARDGDTLAKTGRPRLVYLGRLYLAKLIRRQFWSQNNDLHSSIPPFLHAAITLVVPMKLTPLVNNSPVTTGCTRNLRGIANAHDGRRSAGHILGLKNGNTLLLKP